jgi:hypothetical protein
MGDGSGVMKAMWAHKMSTHDDEQGQHDVEPCCYVEEDKGSAVVEKRDYM